MENTNISRKVKRGELYYYNFGNNEGSVQCGERPVLVVQCDEGNRASQTTVIAAITTVPKKRYLPSHIILGDRFGLKKPSMVLLEQLKTVNQSELTEYLGYIDDPYIEKLINNGLKKALGLWHYAPVNAKNIRCLCSKCLEDYKSNPSYIVRRLDPFNRIKDTCDKCGNFGYDYIVTEKAQKACKGGEQDV